MIYPIWTTLLDQSVYAPINTTFMYGASKLGYIRSVWDNYFSFPATNFDYLLNPQLAIDMVANKMKNNSNGSWSNFGFLGNKSGVSVTNSGSGNFQFDFSALNNITSNNGSGTTNSGSKESKSLESYTKIIDKLLKEGGMVSEQQEKDYREALKKSTAAEKLEAVKKVFKKIAADNVENIRTVILEDEEIKKALKETGYFSGQGDNTSDLDEGTKKLISNVKKDVDRGAFTSLASLCRQNNNVIEVISYWNKSQNNNTDNNRCILRYISNNLKPTSPEGIQNLVLALEEYAERNEFKNCPAIAEKRAALDEAYDKYVQPIMDNIKKDGDFNSSVKSKLSTALKRIIPAFEDLYAQIRIQQAAKIDDDIYTKYGNEINSLIPDIIDTDMIQTSTKADLKKEGIKNIPSPDKVEKKDKYQRNNSSENSDVTDRSNSSKTEVDDTRSETEADIEELVSAEILEDKGNGRYYSKKYDSYYKIDKNGKLYNTTKNRAANIDVMLRDADKAVEEKEKNKVVPLDEAETDAQSAGKTFRKKLAWSTTGSGYISAERKLKSFFATDDTEAIYDFIDGYYLEKGDDEWGYNGRFAAQIASENGWSKEKKIGFIKNIAVQAKKMAEAAGIDPEDDIFDDLNEIIKDGTVDGSWFSNRGARNWWRGNGGLAMISPTHWVKECIQGYDLMKTARILDSIILQIKEEYEAKFADNSITTKEESAKKEENS